MSEAKDIQILNKAPSDIQGRIASRYGELINAIKNYGQKEPDFKHELYETGRGNARIDTTLVVEGKKQLSILIKSDGSVEFYKADPASQLIGESTSKSGGVEQAISSKGKATVLQQADLSQRTLTLGAKEMLGVSHDPRQAVQDFADLANNKKLIEGLNGIKDKAGNNLTYKVNLASGFGVQTEASIQNGNSKAGIDIYHENGRFKVPGVGVTDIDTVLKNVAEATKPPVATKQITDGVTPNNNPPKSIHGELIKEIQALGLKDPKSYQFKTEDGVTIVETKIKVEGEKTLTVVINNEKNGGVVEFHKTSPNSQGAALTNDSEIGRTNSPKQAAAGFKSLVANQELVKGLNAAIGESGKPISYAVSVYNDTVTTSLKNETGNRIAEIVKQPNANFDTNKELARVSDIIESYKPKEIPTDQAKQPQRLLTEKAEDALRKKVVTLATEIAEKNEKLGVVSKEVAVKAVDRELGIKEVDQIRDQVFGKSTGKKLMIGGASALGILGQQLLPQVVGAAQDNRQEPRKSMDAFTGVMGVTGAVAHIVKEVGNNLSDEHKRVATEIGGKIKELAPSDKAVEAQHIASKPTQKTTQTGMTH